MGRRARREAPPLPLYVVAAFEAKVLADLETATALQSDDGVVHGTCWRSG